MLAKSGQLAGCPGAMHWYYHYHRLVVDQLGDMAEWKVGSVLPTQNDGMNKTSRAVIETILSTDEQLSPDERLTLSNFLGMAPCESFPNAALTLTQQEAADLLGFERTTVYRYKKMGILRPEEIAPGTFRYSRADVEKLAREGYRSMRAKQGAKKAA